MNSPIDKYSNRLIQIVTSYKTLMFIKVALDLYCIDHPNDEPAKELYLRIKHVLELTEIEFIVEEFMNQQTEDCANCENKDVCNPPANPVIPKISIN